MCLLIAVMMGWSDCLPTYRPYYQEMWVVYGPTPDCWNRDRHVSYLTSLKAHPLRTSDTVTTEQYNQAIDLYVERMKWYCESQ